MSETLAPLQTAKQESITTVDVDLESVMRTGSTTEVWQKDSAHAVPTRATRRQIRGTRPRTDATQQQAKQETNKHTESRLNQD
jgi:hypothetical protein